MVRKGSKGRKHGGKESSGSKSRANKIVKWAGEGNQNIYPKKGRMTAAEKDAVRISFLRENGCRERELAPGFGVPRGRDNQPDDVMPFIEAQAARFTSMARKRRIYLEKVVNDDGSNQMDGDRRGIIRELQNEEMAVRRDISEVRRVGGQPMDVPTILNELPPSLQ